VTGFGTSCTAITEPLGTTPMADTDAVSLGFPAGTAGSTTKLSGADLVDVRGNLEFGDKTTLVAITSSSPTGVSVVLEKLLSQFTWLSTTSVCEPDDPDSGVSI